MDGKAEILRCEAKAAQDVPVSAFHRVCQFEDSRNIRAEIKGHIAEIKNPVSGRIHAGSIGKLTFDEFAKGRDCAVTEG